MTTVNVKGLSELQTFLNQLPAKIESNIIRGALRAGMKPVKELAIQGCPTGEPSETNKRRYRLYNGALRDSIRISSKTDKRSGKIVSRLVAGGRSKKTGADVYYAIMKEFGTRPHKIGSGNHPGVREHPFMRPALDNGANAAVLAAGEYIKKRLATKHGLDTADINIEVEE
jgi:HK97 gp10 family phage protein